jgi:hypothetical protein
VALAVAGSAIRRKGIARGVADTGLNALPFVGGLKALVETFTGDWFRDRESRPPSSEVRRDEAGVDRGETRQRHPRRGRR